MSLLDFCDCKCHRAPDTKANPIHVDPRERIAAVTACAKCQHKHFANYAKNPAFRRLGFDLSEPLDLPRPADATGTSEDETPPMPGDGPE